MVMAQGNDLVEHISQVSHCIKIPLGISYVNLHSTPTLVTCMMSN